MNKIIGDLEYKLSENFSLYEFKVSSSYPEIAEKMEFTELEVVTLQLLCAACLQPIRDKMGRMKILSGKRSEELNNLIGGSATSDHKTCNAADIDPKEFDVEYVYKWIVEQSNIDYRQVIFYPDQNFIHISVNMPSKPRKHQALVKVKKDGKTAYISYDEYYG